MNSSNENKEGTDESGSESRADGVATILELLLKWGGRTLENVAGALGVSEAELKQWQFGHGDPPKAKFRLLEGLLREACSSCARTLLTALARWGYTETEIAQELNIGVAAVCRWKSGEAAPKVNHLCDLETMHANARDQLLENWVQSHPLKFLCSKAGSRSEDHELQAMSALHLSQQRVRESADDGRFFPLLLDVRFEDLPQNVRGHTFMSRKGRKRFFVILLNQNDPFPTQEQTFYVELDAHVLSHFRPVRQDKPRPRRILRTKSTDRRKNGGNREEKT